jgi:hypothetical protein
MRIPYIVIIRDNQIDTVHQTSESDAVRDLLNYVTLNLPDIDFSQKEIDMIVTRRKCVTNTLSISVVWMNVETKTVDKNIKVW